MLKNLEFVVLKPNELDKSESFSRDFASATYYYYLKLKKREIDFCSYIKIRIVNEKRKRETFYQLVDKILFVSLSYDFTEYLILSEQEKLTFTCNKLYRILNETFKKYEKTTNILDNIQEELAANNCQMQISWIKKKVQKKYTFNLLMNMGLCSFTFNAEITDGIKKDKIFIFKSLPDYFVISYFFTVFKVVDNKVFLGSKERAVFKMDIDKKNVQILVGQNDKFFKMYKYKQKYM